MNVSETLPIMENLTYRNLSTSKGITVELDVNPERDRIQKQRITRLGLEPRMSGPKPDVLPLHHRASFVRPVLTKLASYKNRVYQLSYSYFEEFVC